VSKDSLRRAVVVLVLPVAAYALVRPLVSSDMVGLAAAAIPIAYSISHALARRRVDPLAALSALGFSFACLVSFLTGGGALPLKLHEAFITLGLGLVLITAVVIRRPLPIGRLLRTPDADRSLDGVLGAIIGGFLIVHALLHLALPVTVHELVPRRRAHHQPRDDRRRRPGPLCVPPRTLVELK
jgi:hypothetical protein